MRKARPGSGRPAWCVGSLVLLLSVVAALFGVPAAQPPPRAAVVSCDRVAVMNARLDELGRAGHSWRIGFVPDGLWGVVGYPGPRDVTVSDSVPCDVIVSIVNHEWMHTRQERLYPGRAQRAYGEVFEVVADCGSMLLGSPISPCLDRRATGSG